MWKLSSFFVCIGVTLMIVPDISLSKDLQIPCDIDQQNSSCPDGYCCVRDDFLFTETYCKQLGGADSSCTTMPSNFECHCQDGFVCASNIHGPHSSVFGKCRAVSGSATGVPVDMTTDGVDQYMTTESSSQQGNSQHNDTGVAIVG